MPIETLIQHSNPDVSVVIPTIPENNYQLPDSLKTQTDPKYEVIIVSDGSIDRCQARNQGMQVAKGDIIAQTDDDCRPPKTWIEDISKAFESNPKAVILGGRLDKHHSGPHRYIGANMAYRKKEALAINGFDTELAGWRADTDFGWRMEIEYGVDRTMFDPQLEVVHIGPLRTSVDRKLERKFRRRYPIRYFTHLYSPNIKFGKKLGFLFGCGYSLFPNFSEYSIKIYRRCRNIRVNSPSSK